MLVCMVYQDLFKAEFPRKVRAQVILMACGTQAAYKSSDITRLQSGLILLQVIKIYLDTPYPYLPYFDASWKSWNCGRPSECSFGWCFSLVLRLVYFGPILQSYRRHGVQFKTLYLS